jgi:hypothetical protein
MLLCTSCLLLHSLKLVVAVAVAHSRQSSNAPLADLSVRMAYAFLSSSNSCAAATGAGTKPEFQVNSVGCRCNNCSTESYLAGTGGSGLCSRARTLRTLLQHSHYWYAAKPHGAALRMYNMPRTCCLLVFGFVWMLDQCQATVGLQHAAAAEQQQQHELHSSMQLLLSYTCMPSLYRTFLISSSVLSAPFSSPKMVYGFFPSTN